MNRKEAIDEYAGIYEDAIYVVNKLYDSFESRACDNCNDKNDCDLYEEILLRQYEIKTKDFSCNKWISQ